MTFRSGKTLQLILFTITAIALASCASQRTITTDFDLRDPTERAEKILFTQTRHIDSANPAVLMTDVWKLEHYAYPDSIRLFVRVLDSTGNVITHMAAPYKKAGVPDYFTSLSEKLGTGRRSKEVIVPHFRVREYGEQDSIPVYVSMALDYSGSMKGALDAIAKGTEIFVSLKRPVDVIALTAFHRKITRVFPLSTDTKEMIKLFREYHKHGLGLYTTAYDGIMQALRELEAVPIHDIRVLIVFADGDENHSTARASAIYEYAARNNISIYGVGFGYARDEELESLCLYTGGKYYRAFTKADLMNILLDIWRSLRNYYLVHYVPPQYDGLHEAIVHVEVTDADTLRARGIYDRSALNPLDPTDEFSRPILFAYNRADIDSASMYIIDEIADNMDRFERVELEVQGHTDNIGGEEFNMRLSIARAESVRDALVQRGITPRRLRIRGFGLTQPVAPNDSEENRARNRRTVFRILRK